MLHAYQKVIVYSWMCDVVQHAGEEASHDLQVWDVSHKLTIKYKIMKVSSCINYPYNIMELSCFITLVFDSDEKRFQILFRYLELFY